MALTTDEGSRYAALGVSSAKGDVKAAIAKVDPGISPTLFCKTVADLAGDPAFCSIAHADGAGTKSSLAYAYWKETGDLSVFRGIAQDSLVMNVDDVLCNGARGPMFVTSNFARNRTLVPAEVVAELVAGTEAFLEKLNGLGLTIQSCGGETADVGDLVRTLVVDHNVFTRMQRSALVDTKNIQIGDVVVALASFGKASYEDVYNSGIGSNGLTLARHGVFTSAVGARYPETFDPALGGKAFYGKHALTENLNGTPLTFGQAVLSPTRTYAPVLLDVMAALGSDVHAMIHCSGGGQTKVLGFLNGKGVVKKNLFDAPPLFAAIQESGAVSWREMFQVFNMGHRMEVYCPEHRASDVISLATRFHVDARAVGVVVAAETPFVELETPYGTFKYSKQ